MTNKEYRQHEGLSRSELFTLIDKTPLHFQYEQLNKKEDTPSLAFGRAAHKYILERSDFLKEFAVAPAVDKRTKEGKAAWLEHSVFCEENGLESVSADDFKVIQDMAAAIDADPIASELLKGQHEQSFFWEDTETGEKLKCRPDCITSYNGKFYLVDYKTTTSCADGAFEREARKYGYDFQTGFYIEGVFQNTFEDYGFVFIAQEKTAPYAVRVYFCSDDFIEEGADKFRSAVNLYKWCKDNNRFYGYEGADGSPTTLIGSNKEV